jgi:hypothetical protein
MLDVQAATGADTSALQMIAADCHGVAIVATAEPENMLPAGIRANAFDSDQAVEALVGKVYGWSGYRAAPTVRESSGGPGVQPPGRCVIF